MLEECHHITNNALDPKVCQAARLSRDARFDGKFFTAVLSTGIYCRPVCPARAPKPENVVYYQSAMQAQQAGFQPCKRCFPELAPALNLSVKMKQLTQALEESDGNISRLAQQFSTNERQLHRLFIKHYGVPPSKFLHHQRLLLARKLLSTTALSITDICFASGFQSVRRFNEAIKAAYLCTPSALRKKSALTPHTDSVTVLLPYRPPFDWSLMLGFFRHRQMPHVEQIDETHYRRTFSLGTITGWLEVGHHKTKNALELTVSMSDYQLLNQVIMRVKRMFDLDADMTSIHQHFSCNAILANVINHCPGLRLPGCWDIFEFSIRAILGQQISVRAATTYADRIAARYGNSAHNNPFNLQTTFPTIEELNEADFAEMGLTNARIATLQTWLNFYQHNSDIFSHYQSIEQLEQTLTELKGIGPWTVNYIAMRGLSDPDAFPSADLGIIKALSTTANTSVKSNNKQILAMAEQWRPWRAYAAIYLWQSLALKEN
ncbi:DNA-3-methyladenine glycosylase 2 family protein [Colwelliaceae bacterium 6471]